MKNFAILLVLALLLTGCSAAPAQESTVPGTSAPIAEPSTTSQTGPASLSESAPSPEEYYASAESVESLMFQPSWHEANDVWVRAKGDALVLTHQRTPAVFPIPYTGSTIAATLWHLWMPPQTGYTGSTLRPAKWNSLQRTFLSTGTMVSFSRSATWKSPGTRWTRNIWMPALPYGTRNETIFGFRRKAPSPVPQRPANAGETAQILTFGRTAPFWNTLVFITWSMRRWRTVDTRKPMPPTAII